MNRTFIKAALTLGCALGISALSVNAGAAYRYHGYVGYHPYSHGFYGHRYYYGGPVVNRGYNYSPYYYYSTSYYPSYYPSYNYSYTYSSCRWIQGYYYRGFWYPAQRVCY